uniref:URB2 ribosome biogenesis 2 homolog n=3 Tax=Iconisemion striatum TaxID=60296 RepID=A0A1A7X9L6_9TELE
MSAIYSGIYLKLKSPQTPWEDRLKLARFAWISSQCLLPNKEQVLLDWCAHALTGWYSKKVDFSQEVLEGLWCYLDDVLHSRKLHSFLKQGETVTLRLNMAQLLLDHLHDCAHDRPSVSVSTIMSVFQGILSSPVLSSVFTTKYELMVNLLAKFCLLASHKIQKLRKTQVTESDMCRADLMEHLQTEPENQSDPPELKANRSNINHVSNNLFEVLLQVLSCYLSVQHQQANPNRVFTLVTNQLIQPLMLLRHLLTSQEFTASHSHLQLRLQLRRDLRSKIDSVLQLALFPSDHLASYKAELFPSKEDSVKHGSGGTKGPLKPVSALLSKLNATSYCEQSLLYPVKSEASSLLFRFFLESYGKRKGESEEECKMLCFYFLIRLVPTLDLYPDGCLIELNKAEQQDSGSSKMKSVPGSSWSLALQAVESLLSQSLSADIYNVAADRIRHGEVQLGFYRSLAQMLLKEAQPSISSWYRCLKVFLSLNHLILEPDLDQLLTLAWVNAEDVNAQVQRARQNLVCSLLQTYTKLHQLPRLFSVLLSVICQPARDDRHPPLLSEGISTSLRTCLLDTPSSQVLEICSSMLKSIRTCLLPDLASEQREVEKMEIDGENNVERREDASLKLLDLSQLLHDVLFSLKTLDNSSPVPLVRQSKGFMEEMQQTIREMFYLLLENRTLLRSNLASAQKILKKGKKNRRSENISKSQTATVWEQKTQEALLLLRYTWVEVDTLFHLHCSKYTSVDSFLTAAEIETEDSSSSPVLVHMESLLSGSIIPSLHPSSLCSPMSCLLLKLLTLQQMKKVLVDHTLLGESSSAALLNRSAQFIVAKLEHGGTPEGEQSWDGQIGGVNANSYPVAHWHLVISNLPLIGPHLSGEDVRHVAHVLVSSLLKTQTEGSKDHAPGSLTFSLISAQLALNSVFPELASLFSATIRSLTQRIISLLEAGCSPKGCPKFLRLHKNKAGGIPSDLDDSRPVFSQETKEAIIEDVLTSSETGEMLVLLTDTQITELGNLIQILTNLNAEGMSSEDLSSIFLLLLFTFTSTSRQLDQVVPPETGGDPLLLGKLLRALTLLLEGSSFQSVLKLIHGGTLLQTALSSLLCRSSSTKLQETCRTDWLDLVKAAQGFTRSLVNLIIIRNSSVRLNLDQFASFLTSKEMAARQSASSGSGASVFPVHLLLTSLTSFSQTMTSNLGRSKPMDETLIQMLARITSLLGPAVETFLKHHTNCNADDQPASTLGQAFVVEVVTAMLDCELASLSVDVEGKQNGTQLAHMTLYQVICQQILREMSSAPRPMDFLVSSLHFLSSFYKVLLKTRAAEEMEQLYVHILQNLLRLLKAPWLSSADVGKLEPGVQELLCHLVEESTTSQFNLLLLMIREGLDISKLRAGNYREVLSAVIAVKLLSSCQLPKICSRALWLTAPQILSAIVFLVRSSSQDASLTLPFTIPTVTSMTSILRQGEGLITNPHHVILILGALQSLPLDHLAPSIYHSVFLAVHEALFTIIQCHPQVVSTAAPSFLNVFYRLVASIMQEGRQKGDVDTGVDSDVHLQCSRLVERMYSHIAAAAESFTALPAFMVAQYVTELQKVTLRPDIKLHLTEGVYCILDLCMEQDIKFLKAGLNTGVREVFNELHGSYVHYHKPQRQGEDKYTV